MCLCLCLCLRVRACLCPYLCFSVCVCFSIIINPPPQPFSNGLVTVMVPQLRRENSLLLWSTLDLNSPVHAFVGHDDVVLEFQWRPQKEGEQNVMLILDDNSIALSPRRRWCCSSTCWCLKRNLYNSRILGVKTIDGSQCKDLNVENQQHRSAKYITVIEMCLTIWLTRVDNAVN